MENSLICNDEQGLLVSTMLGQYLSIPGEDLDGFDLAL